jgi:hypothetical protein
MKYFVIPVIIGATEIVTKGLTEYLEAIPGKHLIDVLEKNSCTRDVTRNKLAAKIRNLKRESWGTTLMQEKYQGTGNLG